MHALFIRYKHGDDESTNRTMYSCIWHDIFLHLFLTKTVLVLCQNIHMLLSQICMSSVYSFLFEKPQVFRVAQSSGQLNRLNSIVQNDKIVSNSDGSHAMRYWTQIKSKIFWWERKICKYLYIYISWGWRDRTIKGFPPIQCWLIMITCGRYQSQVREILFKINFNANLPLTNMIDSCWRYYNPEALQTLWTDFVLICAIKTRW